MARDFKDKADGTYDYHQLHSSLVQSGMQKDNPALFNVLGKLISGAHDFQTGVNDSTKNDDLINLSKRSAGVLPAANGGISNGNYMPVITPISNVAAFLEYYSLVSVSRRRVDVTGKLTIAATAAAVLTELDLELPIHSKFSSPEQLQGLINGIPLAGATVGFSGIITANIANGQAKISYYPQNIDNHDIRFMLSYELI